MLPQKCLNMIRKIDPKMGKANLEHVRYMVTFDSFVHHVNFQTLNHRKYCCFYRSSPPSVKNTKFNIITPINKNVFKNVDC